MVDDFKGAVVSSDNGAHAHVMHNAQRECGSEHECARELHKLKPDTILAQWREMGMESHTSQETIYNSWLSRKRKSVFFNVATLSESIIYHGQLSLGSGAVSQYSTFSFCCCCCCCF